MKKRSYFDAVSFLVALCVMGFSVFKAYGYFVTRYVSHWPPGIWVYIETFLYGVLAYLVFFELRKSFTERKELRMKIRRLEQQLLDQEENKQNIK